MAALDWIFHLVRIAMDPLASSVLAAGLVGEPELGRELVAICRRESHCRLVGAHEADRWAGRSMHANATRVGWLDPQCGFHRGSPARFSTRGVHGLSAAYSLRFLGTCLPPEALDVPLLSAIAAARRAVAQCRQHGACTPDKRHRMWMGQRRFDRARRVRRTS